MSKLADNQRYEERINRVTSYIPKHLDGDLSLHKLAEIAFMSPYHFHRIYRTTRGETIITTVRRLRMLHAALFLTQSDMSIGEIAQKCGYNNTQSFTRLFKSIYGKPPANFRYHENPSDQAYLEHIAYKVSIQSIDSFDAIYVAHSSLYLEASHAFDRLFTWLNLEKFAATDFQKLRILIDDPCSTPSHLVRSLACVTMNSKFKPQPPLEVIVIPGGKYTVVRHKGPYENLDTLYSWFSATRLGITKVSNNNPVFEKYINNSHTTPQRNLLTDVYFPLQSG
jgi:AraC family transcriptional regulator